MSELPAIRLAAFDMGGVLIDNDESIPVSTFAELSGRTTEEVFNAIFSVERKRPIETGAITRLEHALRISEELALEMDEQEFWSIHCTSHTPSPEVGEIVTEVSKLVPVTIASNLPLPHWDWARANLPYAHLFNPPLLSFEIGVMKPDVAYYEELVRRSGVEPEAIFFTDDRMENIDAALETGIRAFLFEGPDRLRADLRSCGIDV